MIEILDAGPLASVQDLGRAGYLRYGVGSSGAMDRLALQAGNILLGNAGDEAAVEIQAFPFRARFERETAFAVTGGDCAASLDGAPLPPWWASRARAGAVLTLNPPRRGARAYLTVSGGIDVPLVLGSRSTQFRGAFGGHEGRNLRSGDRLGVGEGRWRPADAAGVGVEPPDVGLAAEWAPPDLPAGTTAVRVLAAGEYELFTEEAIRDFWGTGWKISSQSNRAGYRLAGHALSFARRVEMRSHGIVPGVVQVPPSGQPIIQLSDAHTAGGYPKIGTVIEADLWRLGQVPLGTRLRFVPVDYQGALAALRETEAWLESLRRHAASYRALLSRACAA